MKHVDAINPNLEEHVKAAEPERRLPLSYYLDNFELAVRTVLLRDTRFFNKAENQRLKSFRSLPLAQRRMLVRIFARKTGWHRVSTLLYDEIPDPETVYDRLVEDSFLRSYDGKKADTETVVSSLRVPECRVLLKEAGLPCDGRVDDLKRRVSDSVDVKRIREVDRFVELSDRDLYRRVLMLFFANRRQDLSDFVIRDVGNLRYETVRLSKLRLFGSRKQAVKCLLWADWRDEVLNAHDSGDETALAQATEIALNRLESTSTSGCSYRGRHLLLGPLITLARHGAARFEKSREYEGAVTVLHRLLAVDVHQQDRLQLLQRLMIDLEKCGRPLAALRAAQDALAETTDPVFERDLRKRVYRLSRKVKHHTAKPIRLLTPRERTFTVTRLPTQPGSRNRFVSSDGTEIDVETVALDAYRRNLGYHGVHVENALPASLTALCFWDIIYEFQPGAFLHEFQTGPLDWGGSKFFARRRTPISRRLDLIRQDKHLDMCLANLSSRWGISNPLYSWNQISAETIAQVLRSWPGESLANCLELKIKDSDSWRRGFPDLVLFKPDGQMLFSEVKGPVDSVGPAQSIWFDLLIRNSLAVELCFVNEA